jgi:hypothetical protein
MSCYSRFGSIWDQIGQEVCWVESAETCMFISFWFRNWGWEGFILDQGDVGLSLGR